MPVGKVSKKLTKEEHRCLLRAKMTAGHLPVTIREARSLCFSGARADVTKDASE